MKRANGTGTVEVRADGRARVRVVVNGKREQLGPIYPNEDRAREVLEIHNALLEGGEIEDASGLLLGLFGAQWLESRELHGSHEREKVKSVAGEKSVWRRHVAKSDLAAMAIRSIRPRHVQDFVRWLRTRKAVHAVRTKEGTKITETDRTISRAMRKEALRLVRQCLDEAIRQEIIATNPANVVAVGKGGRVKDVEDDWLRANEIDKVLACDALALRDRTAFACAIGLSLRSGDLKAIEVAHVHLDAVVPGPHVRVWVSKSEKWHNVPVLPWLKPWLEAHLATLPKSARWLFPADDRGQVRYGKHYTFNWAEKLDKTRKTRRASALELAGVERRIRFHDLRGTCATHLAIGTWGRTWSLHEIQRMLAHSDQRVTERYVRRALDMLAQAAAATPNGPAALPLVAPAALSALAENINDSADSGSVDRTHDQSVNSGAPASMISRTCGSQGQPWGNGDLLALARDVLTLGQTESVFAPELAEAITSAVLESASREVQLALEVRAGGPYAARRLLELAALLAERLDRVEEAFDAR